MSATRDKNQKIAFVYSNLYRIYKQGKAKDLKIESSEGSSNHPGLTRVIKVGEVNPSTDVQSYEPVAFVRPKKIAKPIVKEIADDPETKKTQLSAVSGLKKNLKDLTQIQSRLRFMLTELEDLIDEDEE